MRKTQYCFDFYPERCVQCHACEVACKGWHGVELGVQWRRVTSIWSGEYPRVVSRSISLSCMHCGDPACERVCPSGAVSKREQDGVVCVDQRKCIGCRSCFLACPFGVPVFGKDGRMQKCELCTDRLEEGKEPICVSTCPTEALRFGVMDDLAQQKAANASARLLTFLIGKGLDRA